jgi:hypothetical protein
VSAAALAVGAGRGETALGMDEAMVTGVILAAMLFYLHVH